MTWIRYQFITQITKALLCSLALALPINACAQNAPGHSQSNASISTPESKNSSKLWIDYLELTWWNEKLAEIFAWAEDTCISEYGEGKAAKYWPKVVSKVSTPWLEEFNGLYGKVFKNCMSNSDLTVFAEFDVEKYPYLKSEWELAKWKKDLAKSEEDLAKSEEDLAQSEEDLAKAKQTRETFEKLAGSN